MHTHIYIKIAILVYGHFGPVEMLQYKFSSPERKFHNLPRLEDTTTFLLPVSAGIGGRVVFNTNTYRFEQRT